MGIAEIEPLARFGDDDCRAPVGRKVHVIRVIHWNIFSRFARRRIDGRDAAVVAAFGIVVDP